MKPTQKSFLSALLILALFGLPNLPRLDAQPLTVLHPFSGGVTPFNYDGASPSAGLIQSGNTLYGTSFQGGASGNGTVFRVNTDGSDFTNLYNFTGGNDGANPVASLILSGNTLYGTANQGGTSNNGTVFAVNTDGTGFTNLYNFTGGNDGGNPAASLVQSGNILYGTASFGGSAGAGTIFAVNTNGSGFTKLYTFTGGNDGANPMAGLILSGGTLYGTASQGGSATDGTVFAVSTNGSGFTRLYSFTGTSDGASPVANLILVGSTLYGTASQGGSSSHGTLFAINTNGTGFVNYHNFTGGSDGNGPAAGLILSGNNLYGTAGNGGSSGSGVLFAINTNGTGFTSFYTFTGGSDGANPLGSLILSGKTLYTTTSLGGLATNGTVFAVSTNGSAPGSIHQFSTFLINPDGNFPIADLTLAGGTLYGTTYSGGTSNQGLIFKISTNGSSFTYLYSFTGSNDGANPRAGLLLAGNKLFGTTYAGGSSNFGTVFAINTDGSAFTNLYTFTGIKDGGSPSGRLILSGTTLYGTSAFGSATGTSSAGTVFAVSTNGSGFTNLFVFAGTNGAAPYGGLVLSGSTLYGTTSSGGAVGGGTVFAINTNGSAFTNLYSFTGGTDGATPYAGLTLSGNTLFGTTFQGGTYNAGTIFAINTNGSSFTNVYDFTAGGDGSYPQGGLALSSNYLFGVASQGGGSGNGTAFAIRTDGSNFKTLYSFSADTNGYFPYSEPVVSGATLYGTTLYGGGATAYSSGSGTIYALDFSGVLGPLPVISVQPINNTVSPNGSVSLSVTATNGPLTYQWLLNGTNVPGANASSFFLANVAATNIGVYTVIVSNASGSVTSTPSFLASISIGIFTGIAPKPLAGVIINGPLGSNYLIQSTANLASGSWTTLTNVALPTRPYTYDDFSSATNRQQFYRAFPQ